MRSIDDQAVEELLGRLPMALLNQVLVAIRASSAAEPRMLPRSLGGFPLVTPADFEAGGSAAIGPLSPGTVIYLPRGWTVQRERQQWRLTRVSQRCRYSTTARRGMPVDTLVPGPQDESLDAFFKDIARAAGSAGIGLLTARCASAGRLGLRALAEAGGLTMLEEAVQESSCAFVDYRDRVAGLAADLQDYLEHLTQWRNRSDGGNLQREIAAAFPTIVERLCERTAHSFQYYKASTMIRRVRRRMQVLRIHSLPQYLERLECEPAEVGALFSELLIGVTQFFRDPAVFETLEREVVPQLFDQAERSDPVRGDPAGRRRLRVWVPGCSTGQEAYSLAMLLAEEAERRQSSAEIQVIGTDIDEAALAEARRGIYPRGIEREISPTWLSRFFSKCDGQYRVDRTLRRFCRFTSHNVISDPPLLHMDMISCRNLLVYLRPHLQKRLIPVFHQSLRPQGILVVGLSESTRTHTHLFHPLNTRYRISRRKTLEGASDLRVASHRADGHYRGHAADGPGASGAGAGGAGDGQTKSGKDGGANERIEQLERELQSARADLERTQLAIEAANQAKSEFLANMSHEIRTPMTAILGYADLVAEQLTNPLALEQVETIRRNGKFLLGIINDILDLSKIDAGKLEIRREPVDVGQLITDVCSLMEVRVREKGLQLIVEFENHIPQTIETDPTRLRQVLVNLIGNAIKFTDHGLIEVVVRHHDARQQLEVDVIDTGIGIAEEAQAGLFAPFTQVDTSITRPFGGTGLGLAITRRLAEMLGGEVSLESRLGRGSRFTVAIATGPLEGVPRVAPVLRIAKEETKFRDQDRVQARILVVDDSRDIRVLASTLLKRSGASVVTAEGGQEAVDAVMRADAEGNPFSLVFMDVQMPGVDGPTAVARLREAGFTLPIVALTANAMQGDRERCLRRGYTDYLSKPLDIRVLSATLQRYLRV